MKLSSCCKARVRVEGLITHYYVCVVCRHACDVIAEKPTGTAAEDTAGAG
jgi:hypothetical protein